MFVLNTVCNNKEKKGHERMDELSSMPTVAWNSATAGFWLSLINTSGFFCGKKNLPNSSLWSQSLSRGKTKN